MTFGPSHQQSGDEKRGRRLLLGTVGLFAFVTFSRLSMAIIGLAELIIAGVLVWKLVRFTRRVGPGLVRVARTSISTAVGGEVLPLHDMVDRGGVYLGVDKHGARRFSRREHAVLVIGPPRSGKTSGVIIPTLLTHQGPAVSTSTKPDVLHATSGARADLGRVWQFDPTGATGPAPGVETLRWSPLASSSSWDGALLMARAMVDGASVGSGVTDRTHWAKRAQALLAGLLHAAAVGNQQMRVVVGWVTTHDLDTPSLMLGEHGASPLAASVLEGLRNTEERERSSIFSAAADALDAYTSQAALDATDTTNFYAGRFVRSADTIYIHAPAEAQQQAAPLVCGLLAEIRRATYQAHAAGVLPGQMLFALDEVANIAPIAELPQIASEGGSQGLLLLAALQDLSQARARWGAAADGFLTLFGTKLILPGVADPRTLETVSVALGEYDRQVVANTRTRAPGQWQLQRGQTVSTHRQRVLSPGEIANIPAGHGLRLDGVRWELLTLTPAHTAAGRATFEAVV
jgi:type IV secretory pathway TraG/TraD family ATPase VirD4